MMAARSKGNQHRCKHPVRARKLAGFVDKALEMQGVE
jgi:hypothetical protein